MKFVDTLAARRLMQPVNVLRDHSGQLAVLLPLRQLFVSCVGFGGQNQHFIPVETVKLFRIPVEKGVGKDLFRRIIILLIVQPVRAAKVRDPALRGDAGTAEKDDPAAGIDQLLKLFICHNQSFFLLLSGAVQCLKTQTPSGGPAPGRINRQMGRMFPTQG